MLIVGITFGTLLWFVFELNKAYTKPDFKLTLFVKYNTIPFITNLLCGFAIVWFREDISEYVELNKFTSVVIGFGAQAFFTRLVGVFDKRVNTAIGVNK